MLLTSPAHLQMQHRLILFAFGLGIATMSCVTMPPTHHHVSTFIFIIYYTDFFYDYVDYITGPWYIFYLYTICYTNVSLQLNRLWMCEVTMTKGLRCVSILSPWYVFYIFNILLLYYTMLYFYACLYAIKICGILTGMTWLKMRFIH